MIRRKGRFVSRKINQRLEELSQCVSERNRRASVSTEDTIDEDSSVWMPGERRIFEPYLLQQKLKDGCTDCGDTLRFTNVVNETKCGLGFYMYVMCSCGTLNTIKSGKVHHDPCKLKTRPIFDINSKAAIAMYDTGFGPMEVDRFLANINISGMNQAAFKKREREVSTHIKQVAEDSLDTSLEEEKSKSPVLYDGENEIGISSLVVKYDMGWQKRGSGRKYDSKSGVGVMIGNITGKIIERGVRSSDCRVCTYWEGRKTEIPEHNCSRNWYGTAKGMEPDVGATLVKKLEEKDCQISTVVMDDDATTMARIKQKINHPVSKWSDTNHVKSQFNNKLWNLKNTYKKDLCSSSISHLNRCFSYAILSNKNDKESMMKDMKAIVPHVYNDHQLCNSKWCSYKRNPEQYKPTVEFTNPDLRNKLEALIAEYTSDSNIEKIAPCGSTKEVESFNNMVANKASKSKHLCASGSLESRVDCAVAQKNLSYGYVSKVFEECGMSPGKITEQSSGKLVRKRKYQNNYQNSKNYKLRKLSRKRSLNFKDHTVEIREGDTFKKSVDMEIPTSIDIDYITDPEVPPALENVDINSSVQSIVYFDLETTSLSLDCDIIQISAIKGTSSFNENIFPSKEMSRKASEVTGLSVVNNTLVHNGQKIDAKFPETGFQNLIFWLEQIPTQVILAGHNSLRFDAPRLVNSLSRYNLCSTFKEKVVGFVDTLPVFRQRFPDIQCHKQEFLASHLLDAHYEAHNALSDVEMLQSLVHHINPTNIELKTSSFTTESLIKQMVSAEKTNKRTATLKELVNSKSITLAMSKRIAQSGLDMSQLLIAFRRNQDSGVYLVLSEKRIDGKPRVTSCRRVAVNITIFLKRT